MSEESPDTGRLLDEAVASQRELVRKYWDRVNLAEDVARAVSGPEGIVGRVSVIESIGGEEIPVDMPPETWVSIAHRNPGMLGEGYYYVVVDPKTLMLVLATVAETVKPSTTSGLGAQQPLVTVPLERPHPLSIAGNVVSLRLVLRPLLAIHLGEDNAKRIAGAPSPEAASGILSGLEASPPTIPPDPGSPVAVPDPAVLGALVAPREEGVLIGGLAVMDSLYLAGDEPVAIRLPWSVLVKHVLVTGTTGSGKTSLVKNMMLDASRREDVHIVVLDASSDYVAGLLPGYIPRDRVTREAAKVLQLYGANAEPGKPVLHKGLAGVAVTPCPSCGSRDDYLREAKEYRSYLEKSLSKSYEKHGCTLELGEPRETTEPLVYRVDTRVECRDTGAEEQVMYIAPRKILVARIDEVAQLDPYLTQRARESLRLLVANCGAKTLDDLLAVLEWKTPSCNNIVKNIHQETRRNLETRLRALSELGIIGYHGRDPAEASLDYTLLAETMERLAAGTLVLDLGYAATTATKRTRAADSEATKVFLGYQLLRTLATHMEQARKPSYALLVIDEAHLFFPYRAQEYTQLLRQSIERLARLGRSRGIAIIFSTHRETDVSPLVATLTNTKIYLRTDKKTADELPLPQEYKRRIPYYRDHAAIIASYAIKGGYLAAKNAPPLIGHKTT